MFGPGVHRVFERQVATIGDRIAVSSATDRLTYRELNQRANIVARRLMACGLRRRSRVIVKMDQSPQLAVVLLAALKGGAAYMWICGDDGGRWPQGVSVVRQPDGDPEALIIFDPSSLLHLPVRSTPNLPIITRPEDLACVVPSHNGHPGVLVPHATITALQSHPLPDRPVWSGDVMALDLWLPLMAGATVTVQSSPAQIAAA
jgi:non-ribosomal peptide synthetase component F